MLWAACKQVSFPWLVMMVVSAPWIRHSPHFQVDVYTGIGFDSDKSDIVFDSPFWLVTVFFISVVVSSECVAVNSVGILVVEGVVTDLVFCLFVFQLSTIWINVESCNTIRAGSDACKGYIIDYPSHPKNFKHTPGLGTIFSRHEYTYCPAAPAYTISLE